MYAFLEKIRGLETTDNLRVWQRSPVQPGSQRHSSGPWHVPCTQPGKTAHCLHFGPCQPNLHLQKKYTNDSFSCNEWFTKKLSFLLSSIKGRKTTENNLVASTLPLNYQLRTLTWRGSSKRWFHCFDQSLPALITAHYSTITSCTSPAFSGLFTISLAGETIGSADWFRTEHALPSRITGAFEAYVTTKNENFFQLFGYSFYRWI